MIYLRIMKELRKSICILIFIVPTIIWGQVKTEKFFYDNDMNLCDSAYAKYVALYLYKDTLKGSGTIRISFIKGGLKSECEYSDISTKKSEGISTYYHDNGLVKLNSFYVDGELDGELKTFYSNGQLKRKEVYEKGDLISGKCYTKEGKDTTHFAYEIMPEYPGGEKALLKFISDNTKYPKKAKKKNISGKVIVKFAVDVDGKVKDVKISKSAHPLIDEEALRVIRLLEDWTPGFKDGEAIKVVFAVPIKFTLT